MYHATREGTERVDKVKEQIKEKAHWLIKKENVIWLVTMIVYILLFTKTCAQLVYGAESRFQTLREAYFFNAAGFFLIFVLSERKVNLFSKLIFITLIT